jgi:cytochrome c553
MTKSLPMAHKSAHRFGPAGFVREKLGVAAIFTALVVLATGIGNEQSAGQSSAAAQGGPVTQQQIDGTVHVCTSCHGFGGRSISPTFPNLAGQQHDYIVAQLQAFRDHTRADPHAHTYMWGMAAHLSDAMIEGLAKYFSSQPPAAATPGDPALIAAGKKIFTDGISDRGVPACMSCHGDKAQGAGTIPRLADQHPGYIEEQLTNFASMARANEIMHMTSKDLKPEEIRALAAYVGSL